MDDKKGGFVFLFLSLSFTHFTMIYKKKKKSASLLSIQMGTATSYYSKIGL
jgi:hypothetical protein